MKLSPQRRRETIVFSSVVVIYILFWLWIPKPSFWGLDNGFKYQGAESFSEHGYIRIPYSGIGFDEAGKFRPIQSPFGVLHGNYQIPTFPIMFMAVGGMFMLLFGKIGPHLLSLSGGLITIAAGWLLWTLQRPKRDASIYILLLGMASPLMFYSMTLWEHSWAMALVLLSFAALFQKVRQSSENLQSRLLLIASGLAVSMAAAMRTEAIIWVFVTVLFWRQAGKAWKVIPLYLLGVVLGIGSTAFLNFFISGQFFPLHLTTNMDVQSFSSAVSVVITWINNFYIALFSGFRGYVFSIIGLVPLALLLFRKKWRRNKRIWLWIAIAVCVTFGFYWIKVMTAPNHPGYMSVSGGLFWILPVAVLALMRFKGEKRPMVYFLWISSGLFILLYSIGSPTASGIHWGPRLILTAVPPVLFLTTVRLRRWWKSVKETRVLIAALLFFSVIGQFYSLFILHDVRVENRDLNCWIASAGSTPVVTSMWWMAGDCALQSTISPWYCVKTGEDLVELVGHLRDDGAKRFNYLEIPPYIDDGIWEQMGVMALSQDYFKEDENNLRQTWLKIRNE